MSIDSLNTEAIDPNTSSTRLKAIARISHELAILVASNVNADSQLLRMLATTRNFKIQKAVTKNPNTPSDILWQLASKFPHEFFANPVLNLLFLENPNFILEQPFSVLLKLLEVNEIPEWFLLQAAQHRDSRVLFAVANCPNINNKIISKLIETGDREVCLYFAKQTNISDEIISKLIETGDREVCLYFAKQTNISDEIISKLIETGDREVCLYFATKKSLSQKLLQKLSETKIKKHYPYSDRELDRAFWIAIAQHPNISLELLHQFKNNLRYTVRIAARKGIAQHPDTDLETLSKLAFDAEPSVKKAVALRDDLSIELIAKMATDRQICRKKFLLRNRSFSEDLLFTLAQSSEPKVLQLVALHPNTPVELLERLATIPSVSSVILQNPKLSIKAIEKLAASNSQNLYLALAKCDRVSTEILQKIARESNNLAVLIAVTQNKNTSKIVKTKILDRLSGINNRSVRQYVARHPNTPHKILFYWGKSQQYYKLHPYIAQNPHAPAILLDYLAHKFCSKKVAINLAKNLNSSVDTLEFIYQKSRYDFVGRQVLCALSNNNKTPLSILDKLLERYYILHEYICRYVLSSENKSNLAYNLLNKALACEKRYDIYLLQNFDLPTETRDYILQRKAKSYYVCHRKFVARYPQTPTSILEDLSKDKDRGVRDAARFRLDRR